MCLCNIVGSPSVKSVMLNFAGFNSFVHPSLLYGPECMFTTLGVVCCGSSHSLVRKKSHNGH